jgi:hypothetical protein
LNVKKRAPQKRALAKKAKRVAEEELTDESTTSEDDEALLEKKNRGASKPAQVSGSLNANYIRKRFVNAPKIRSDNC